ncbi:MAG: hypothetical protein KF744_09070 [Taibaiella sp.]|nr:hypothetical protein [Taibaiella sp.]
MKGMRWIVLVLVWAVMGVSLPSWGQKKLKDIPTAPSITSGTYFIATQDNGSGVFTDYRVSSAQVATYVGAPTIQQVLSNGNVYTSQFIYGRWSGAPTKNITHLGYGQLRVYDTSLSYGAGIVAPLSVGLTGYPYHYWYVNGYNQNLYAAPSTGQSDTLPDGSGVLSLRSDIPYTVQTADDTGYTVVAPPYSGTLVILPDAAADAALKLPTPVGRAGKFIHIHNRNTTGFTWSFSANSPKTADGTTITAINDETWYLLISDGAYWWRQN